MNADPNFIEGNSLWLRSLYSIGGNQTAALFSGIRLHRLKVLLFVVLSLLLIGIFNNVLTLADVSNEILRIVTGSLLIASAVVPNLIASARERLRSVRRNLEALQTILY